MSRKYGATTLSMKLMGNFDALLFDCDGVIAETEKDAHRVTFNSAFKEKGLTTEWDVEQYGELLKIGGGKERMTAYFDKNGWPSTVFEAERINFVQELHLSKTAKFQAVVESGILPLRAGVMRLIDDAFKNDIPVAVCSTSNVVAVTTIVRKLLGDRIDKIQIFAGDVVANKKPSPDVYLLAAKTLKVEPSRCWVIEDSSIGLKAAKSAEMRCLVTKSIYTRDEDFTGADICIEDLERGLDGPVTINYLNYKAGATAYKAAKLVDNADVFGGGDNNMAKLMGKIAKGDMGIKGMPM
eukprot:CAMPEP_0119034588 /NCGR_PEP_ID=MMETSP1177-20130426/1578_1 /TAXON_ID=2985 /ORGANISM="Ochromonas sp, Strain CCMP1899" /LENGTH=295 /DNA_ID=CAMNT_0006992113 /DNA_START=141 /DNA_END=1028 /DNA_ORIENTATION=-